MTDASLPSVTPSPRHLVTESLPPLDAEWLEPDGLGGFASGTVSGIRMRRYHALLLAARTPPTGRVVFVNGVEAWVETPTGTFALSSQRYAPDVIHPDGASRIVSFTTDPWPTWVYRLGDGIEITQEVFIPRGIPAVVLLWSSNSPAENLVLNVRPLLSGRDYHHLHHENPQFHFGAEYGGESVRWQPYADVPAITAHADGEYIHSPQWYRNFQYLAEQERGLDCLEDLASPGQFRIPLFPWQSRSLVLSSGYDLEAAARAELDAARVVPGDIDPPAVPVGLMWVSLRRLELQSRRVREPAWAEIARTIEHVGGNRVAVALTDPEIAVRERTRLPRAADAYVVRRGSGKTIIAGYPWFTDWGRDTFIAIRGLCLATGRYDDARDILLAWAGAVSEGMLPNRFPDSGGVPEYNAVDASLWYVAAVHESLARIGRPEMLRSASTEDEQTLLAAVAAILEGYARGTRFGIRLDDDGLIAAGEPGHQLTWMDAKVGDRVITPRVGKPVEIQALWLNALRGAADFEARWRDTYERGLESFGRRFWNEERGCLYDVVDVDHRPGTADGLFRPNQNFAAGGLPLPLLSGDRARRVVDAVEERLWTPLGLRSLAPGEPGYCGTYYGGGAERDAAYHQGTVWPWLAGPFVEAWVRVRGNTAEAKRAARERFLAPLLAHMDEAGLGHISEIADADPPHTPRGCPFQAWSVGEVLRLDRVVLAE